MDDHIFTLSAIVEKCLSKKGGKLYVAFVDLEKAFDSVHRVSLFESLVRAGLSGTFLNALKAMYESVISCVRVNNHNTEFFICPFGLKQGCILSPGPFSMFINEIAVELSNVGQHGIQLQPGMLGLFLLLFADDLALLSSTAIGLQNQLNQLSRMCEERLLKINIEKTKVMVFRKGGHLGKKEVWYLGSQKLDVVNNYTYLGYTFTTMLSTNQSVNYLAMKGRKATLACVRALSRCWEISKKTFFKICDVQIQPIILYGAEIWGLQCLKNVEKVHTFACKRFLNVPVRTPNKSVYGELGRYPLYINSCMRSIKYWLKLQTMSDSRLPKQAYKMQLKLDENLNPCWVTRTKNFLCDFGFTDVWQQQGVGDERIFLSVLKLRLLEKYNYEWLNAVNTCNRFSFYVTFKSSLLPEQYFDCVTLKCYRDCLIKIRLGVIPINSNKFRYSEDDRKKLCDFCQNQVEDEFNFVCMCPLYRRLRTKYIDPDMRKKNTFTRLFCCNSEEKCWKLAAFAFHAFKLRQQYLEQQLNV